MNIACLLTAWCCPEAWAAAAACEVLRPLLDYKVGDDNQGDADLKPLYTHAQLSGYQALLRHSTSWLFSGDVTEMVDADDNSMGPEKNKVSKLPLLHQ